MGEPLLNGHNGTNGYGNDGKGQYAPVPGGQGDEAQQPEDSGSACPEIKLCRVIDPRESVYIEIWDVITFFAIFVVSFLTPYESVFFGVVGEQPLWLRACNWGLDIIFLKDMFIQFFLVFQQELPDGSTRWVRQHPKIIWNYLTGWFLLDLLAIIPLDVIVEWCGVQETAETKNILKDIKLVRLFRLCKLGRLQKRWQSKLGISFGVLSLSKFAVVVIIACHWMSCCWGMLALRSVGTRTWLTALIDTKRDHEELAADPFSIYIIGLYWSLMTLTSLGLGDISAQNRNEFLFCIVCIFCSGLIWAYVIGAVCGIISSLDPETIKFQTNMDALNMLMHDHRIPTQMRRRLRTYFFESKNIQRQASQAVVMESLSPGLQGELTLTICREWMSQVWYLQGLETDVLIQISRRLSLMAFSSGETISFPRTLFILARGVAARAGNILTKNAVFGEDLILEDDSMRTLARACALTYLEVLFITGKRVGEVRNEFPNFETRIRRAQCRLAVRRGLILNAWKEVNGIAGIATGVPGPRASNYFTKNAPAFCACSAMEMRERVLTKTPKDSPQAVKRRASMFDSSNEVRRKERQFTSNETHGDIVFTLLGLHQQLQQGFEQVNNRIANVESRMGIKPR